MLSEYMEQYPLYHNTVPGGSFKPKKAYEMAQIPMEGISTTKYDKQRKRVRTETESVCERKMIGFHKGNLEKTALPLYKYS